MAESRPDESGSPSPVRPFTAVVGDDFEPTSGYAFDQAVRMALRIPRSHLHVVHVVGKDTSEAETTRLAGLLRLYIEEKCAIDSCAGQAVGIHVRQGDPAHELAKLAAEVNADVILVGARTRLHLRELWHGGSLATRIVRSSACPVLVVEPRPEVTQTVEPDIEPPCPDCVIARTRSGGAQWWCTRHTEPMRRARHYSRQSGLPFSSPDASLIPTGTGQ